MLVSKKRVSIILITLFVLEALFIGFQPITSTATNARSLPISSDSIYIVRVNGDVKQYLYTLNEIGQVRFIYPSFKAVSMHLTPQQLKQVRSLQFVESITPNIIFKAAEVNREDFQSYADFHTNLKDATELTKVVDVWKNYHFFGNGVVVAVLDTGIDSRHYSLDDMDDDPNTNDPKVILHVSMVPNETINTIKPFYDTNGHGTHVAGIIAGTGAPDYQYIGVAPGAKLIDVKVLASSGNGEGEWILNGMQWCIDHMDEYNITIVNMSLGADENTDGTDIFSLATDEMVMAGLTVVVAAGNAGPKEGTVGTPASSRLAITVGATLKTDPIITSYSSKGPTADGRIKPDIVAPGGGILKGDGIYAPAAGTLDYYVEKRGTSMASPHVAGIAALLLQANPSLTPMQIKQILTDTAIKCEYTNAKSRPNNEEGYGLVQADAAVAEALNAEPLPKLNVTVTPDKKLYYYQWNVTYIIDAHNISGVQFYMVFYNASGFPIFSKVGVTNESGLAEIKINSTELAENLSISGNATVPFKFVAYKLGYEWYSSGGNLVTVDYIPKEETPPQFFELPMTYLFVIVGAAVVVIVVVLVYLKKRPS